MLTAAAFAAIMQLLGAALGPAGRIAALVLLMAQLTSSGGTYPVQTSPGFFQLIHPLLPMTYVVQPCGTPSTAADRYRDDRRAGAARLRTGALLLTVLVPIVPGG